MKQSNIERLSFYLIVVLSLLPIWTVACVHTGDGACHLYNSRILLDWLQSKHVDMYSHFMTANPIINPNWLTNLIQVPLLIIFEPIIAEKIYFTLYVLGFAFGLRFLIRQINPKALYLCSIGMIFVWHHIVFKGFFNNTLSIAVWFWAVGAWLKYRNASFVKAVLIQMFLALLGYLSHPMGFAYTAMMIASLLITEVISVKIKASTAEAMKFLGKQLLRLFVAYLPALILVAIFVMQRKWSEEADGYNSDVWSNFIRMPALVILNSREDALAIATSLFCFSLLGYAIFLRVKEKGLKENDGFLVFVIIAFLTIIFPPSSIMGGFDVPRRLIMLPLLAIIFFVATLNIGKKIQITTILLALIICTGFTIIRLPIQMKSAAVAMEMISCKDKIEPLSTVMTLNFDLEPHSIKNDKIIDVEWTSVHTDCYLGTYKPLIIADNYELNMDYFPLRSIPATNFYYQSDKEQGMFEGQYPIADFNEYKKNTGIQIDYVILYGLRDDKRNHENTLDIMQQLETGYEKIYTSPHGIAELYRNKSRAKNPWKK